MFTCIIDIGSNALRMVIYEGDTLGALERCEKKFSIDITSLLNRDNIEDEHDIYSILSYISNIIKSLNIDKVVCVGTAALRFHNKSTEWIKIVKDRYNLDVEIIPGEKEAYISSLSVLITMKNPEGAVVDLGGGSLEIAYVENAEVSNIHSLRLGTRVLKDAHSSFEEIYTSIAKSGAKKNIKNLYLIGGGFLVILKGYITHSGYLLKNLHCFTVKTELLHQYVEFLLSNNKNMKIDIYAIYLLKALISYLKPEFVVASTYGLKEGLFFNFIEEKERTKDIIYESVKLLDSSKYSDEILETYTEIIKPILINPDNETLQTVALAIRITSDMKNIDSFLATYLGTTLVLTSNIPFSHRQRIMLCVVISYMFYFKLTPYILKLSRAYINKEDYSNSYIIGNALSICKTINDILFLEPEFYFAIQEDKVVLKTNIELPNSIMGKINKTISFINSIRDKAL